MINLNYFISFVFVELKEVAIVHFSFHLFRVWIHVKRPALYKSNFTLGLFVQIFESEVSLPRASQL